MDFKSYLKESAGLLDKEIQKILDKWEQEVKKLSPKLVPLAKAFIRACREGKRIRGTLVRLGYEIARDHLPGEVLKIAAAYEIFHTSILAHDDIIDKSPTRRGQSSLYKRVGISQAITLGDLGFFLAIKVISKSNFSEKEKNEALKLFSKTMVDTAMGQMLDILHADPKLVAKLKTAGYTISGPLKLGAVLAGAKVDLLDQLDKFGEDLGIAFQIRDDILDKDALETGGQEGVKYVSRAKSVIPKITKNKRFVRLLTEMADFLIKRSK